ncbi:cupin domain-containing protein [Salinadaptatus halalkaliphilus]|uniref:Cupin domain-containing protein n=1 Tax=Salinadaptatus halalkaliphilus TaxID=2419781 RepID=A0A4S3TTB1_9EURY|nr:cupin domain-containing protein [Salinadaptatus halalkaliphilus]THE66725.1 cupin domain-containing protein [Salinadaptatus halalkaliphilus]
MGYDTAAKTDPESVVPEEFGGMWFLKDALETDHVGFSILELEPGGKGKEHDETHTDQEEIYYVAEGSIEVELTDRDETVALDTDEMIRLDFDESRQLHNRGDERAKLVLVGAPL